MEFSRVFNFANHGTHDCKMKFSRDIIVNGIVLVKYAKLNPPQKFKVYGIDAYIFVTFIKLLLLLQPQIMKS